jgi:ADP-heptose:LPS heptosyltransferase
MILDDIVQRLVIKFYKTLDRFAATSTTIDIFEQLSNAKHILVCVPQKGDDFSVAQQYLNALGGTFPNAVFSLLLHENQVLIESITFPHQIITITHKHLSPLGIPQKGFINNIQRKQFDVVIDLAPEFNFINTFLCRASGSKLRVCLGNPKRYPFYNFLIRTDPALSLERRFEILVHYLKASVNTIESVKPE